MVKTKKKTKEEVEVEETAQEIAQRIKPSVPDPKPAKPFKAKHRVWMH